MNDALSQTPQHKPRPFVDLLVSIVIPSVILMTVSGVARLGPHQAVIIALAVPLGWGLFRLIRFRKCNFIAVLGLVSVFLSGGIGLLPLDPQWLGVKEAPVPWVIGLAVLF